MAETKVENKKRGPGGSSSRTSVPSAKMVVGIQCISPGRVVPMTKVMVSEKVKMRDILTAWAGTTMKEGLSDGAMVLGNNGPLDLDRSLGSSRRHLSVKEGALTIVVKWPAVAQAEILTVGRDPVVEAALELRKKKLQLRKQAELDKAKAKVEKEKAQKRKRLLLELEKEDASSKKSKQRVKDRAKATEAKQRTAQKAAEKTARKALRKEEGKKAKEGLSEEAKEEARKAKEDRKRKKKEEKVNNGTDGKDDNESTSDGGSADVSDSDSSSGDDIAAFARFLEDTDDEIEGDKEKTEK